MTDPGRVVEGTAGRQGSTAARGPRPALLGAVLLGGLALLAAVLLWPRSPGDDSAEAGFARDMSEHHAQAVAMSLTTLEASDNPRVTTLAYDIATTQSNQVGQMEAWLRFWDLPMARPGDRMEWMAGIDGAHAEMGMDGDTGDLAGTGGEPGSPGYRPMPGMATQTELDELAAAEGEAADVLYLQLMVTHHVAGVEMAEAVLEVSGAEEVTRLAEAMVNGQRSEIELMVMMLEDLGAEPREARADLGL